MLWGPRFGLGPFSDLEYGTEPCELLECAISRHFFAESPTGFPRALALISLLSARYKFTSFYNQNSAPYTNVKRSGDLFTFM